MGEKQGHTPGPWTYGVPSPGANFSIYATRMSIGRLGIASNSKRAAEGEANARLIAAAPCLLRELERMADNMAFVVNHAELGKWTDKFMDELSEARKVIAAATGAPDAQ